MPAWADSSVPMSAHTLPAGTVINANDIEMTVVSDTAVGTTIARTAEDVVGKRLSRNLSAGQMFNLYQLKTPAVVERNSRVQVTYKRPGMELTAEGMALEAGDTGKTIRVLNPDSHSTLMAVVTGPGMVSVGSE